MRKIRRFMLAFVILIMAAANVYAAEGIIKDGRTFVPVRGVFEELGFSIAWEQSTGKASLSDGIHAVSVIKGMNYIKADGKQIYPDAPQQIINGSLYLPLRAVSDAIGADISWSSETKTAHISYNKDVYVKCNKFTAPASTPAAAAPTKNNTSSAPTKSNNGEDYVLNTNTHKFHKPSCPSVGDISAQNKKTYTGTREEVVAMGYEPCKRCDP